MVIIDRQVILGRGPEWTSKLHAWPMWMHEVWHAGTVIVCYCAHCPCTAMARTMQPCHCLLCVFQHFSCNGFLSSQVACSMLGTKQYGPLLCACQLNGDVLVHRCMVEFCNDGRAVVTGAVTVHSTGGGYRMACWIIRSTSVGGKCCNKGIAGAANCHGKASGVSFTHPVTNTDAQTPTAAAAEMSGSTHHR